MDRNGHRPSAIAPSGRLWWGYIAARSAQELEMDGDGQKEDFKRVLSRKGSGTGTWRKQDGGSVWQEEAGGIGALASSLPAHLLGLL